MATATERRGPGRPPAPEERKPVNMYFDRELHRRLKIYCATNEKNVSEVVQALVREFLDSHEGEAKGLEPATKAPRKRATKKASEG